MSGDPCGGDHTPQTPERFSADLLNLVGAAAARAWERDREDGWKMLYGNRHKIAVEVLTALADAGYLHPWFIPQASESRPESPEASSEPLSGQGEPTGLSEAEIAAIAAEYVALFDEIADEVGIPRILPPADGGVDAVARLVQAFGRAGFGVMRRDARPEYIDATDCPICPMLATDRDDALAEAAAARDEIDRLHAENERLKSGGDELWPNAEDIIRRRPVVMLTATMYSLLRSELERLRALEASGGLSDTQNPAAAERFYALRRTDGEQIGEYMWLTATDKNDWAWAEEDAYYDGPVEYEIVEMIVRSIAKRTFGERSDVDEEAAPVDHTGDET